MFHLFFMKKKNFDDRYYIVIDYLPLLHYKLVQIVHIYENTFALFFLPPPQNLFLIYVRCVPSNRH